MAGSSGVEASLDQEDPEGRWAALTTMAVAMVLAMTTWFSATAVLPQLRADWALGSAAASWLTIAVQLGFVAGAVTSAALNLADLVNPRRLMLFGAAGAAVANLGLVVADGPALAMPLRFATGAALACVYPPGLKAISTWFRRGRGTALGVMVGALTLGSAAPHLVNGLGGADWRVVIVVSSLLTITGGALAEVAGRDGPFPFPRAVFDPRQAARAFVNPGVRYASFGYFGHMWELYAMWAWFGVFYADVLARHSPSTDQRSVASIATFAVIGIGALGCWAGGVLGDRWGRTITTSIAMAVSGTCAMLIGLAGQVSSVLALVLGLVWGLTVVADSAQFSTMVTEVGDQSYVGTAVTLQLAVGFTLTVATIWLIPVVVEAVTWRWAFAVLAAGPALGVAAMIRLRRLPIAAEIAGGSR